MFKFGRGVQGPVEKLAPVDNDLEKIVGGIAHQASGLGKEAAGLNGLIDDLAGMSTRQSETFAALASEIEAMVRANQAIENVTRASTESVKRTRRTVEQIGNGVGAVTANLAEVADAAQEITQIALQTRLVAFNASVEAKRAGDAGRGFGVVAEAVKDLAAKVERSSKLIMTTVAQLDARIKTLSDDIRSRENGASEKKGSFDAAVSEVERGVEDIAVTAKQNLQGCAGVLDSVRGLNAQVGNTANALQDARKRTQGFLTLSESLIDLAAESGIRTEDTPFIEAAVETAAEICRLFEAGLNDGKISMEDLFDDKYRPIPGTNPEQFMARFTGFCDQALQDVIDRTLSWSPKVVFGVATDRRGYVPTHNRKCSKPQGKDPVWNAVNCRNRRIFMGRTELAAVKNRRRFLLQTYRRDMGGGNFLLMKDLSVPLVIKGRHWGALRVGYEF